MAQSSQGSAMWSWSAIAAGVVTSLLLQALLTMLALGVGLLSVDLPTANNAPATISTAALLWWIASGIFSAFVGGAVAGAYAPAAGDKARSVHAVAAWAVAALIVICVSAHSSSATFAGMSGPGYGISQRIQTANRPGAPAMTQQQVETLRKAFAITMLASVVGLIAGGVAAGAGGWWGRDMANEVGLRRRS
jgi:hypothetical protein